MRKRNRISEYSIALMTAVKKAFLSSKAREEFEGRQRQNTFVEIFKERRWGDQPSGGGSTIDGTLVTREIVQRVIRDYQINSMVDIPCGDLTWMGLVLAQLPEGFRYIGGDIVPELVAKHRLQYPNHSFDTIDFVKDPIPKVDLIFTRDALQHLAIQDIKKALRNFSSSGCKFLLTTIHLRRFGFRNSQNIRTGRCRDRNLMLAPFNLEDPLVIYSEQHPGHKFLGLWRLPLKTSEGNLFG